MLGAIIGDIVGSVYEWNNIKTKEFPLFREGCSFTDDTIKGSSGRETEYHIRRRLYCRREHHCRVI